MEIYHKHIKRDGNDLVMVGTDPVINVSAEESTNDEGHLVISKYFLVNEIVLTAVHDCGGDVACCEKLWRENFVLQIASELYWQACDRGVQRNGR